MAMSNDNLNQESFLYFPQSPESLHESNAFIQFTSYSYDWRLYGSSLSLYYKEEAQKIAEKDMISDPQYEIFLPVPNRGLGIQDNIKYEEGKGGVNFVNKAATIMMDSIKKAGIVGQLSYAYNEVLSTFAGVRMNEFLTHTFKGISLRQYTYTWNLIPYSPQDANVLFEIIKVFRKASLPEYEPDNWTVKYPNFWIIKPYVNGTPLFEMNYLVVSGVKIDFGGEGQVTFFKDGKPVQTTIEITFKEVYPQGSEVYNYNHPRYQGGSNYLL